jgi:hypothetical protein
MKRGAERRIGKENKRRQRWRKQEKQRNEEGRKEQR